MGDWYRSGDHPRIRGEHSNAALYGRSWSGSSPHTRGALVCHEIPLGPVTDHPRIRGEHCWLKVPLSFHFGSSPHTRGARPAPRHRRRPAGIIPAYAGSTGRRRSCESRRRDHPRIRGEHDGDLSRISHVAGSSPHTRGARQSLAVCRGVGGIIPAYAGSTSPAPAGQGPAPDHPRIRGEHRRFHTRKYTTSGSSPHTRGARRRAAPVVYRQGIIPAYAGSTRGD